MSKYITKQRKILQDYLSKHIDEELSAKQVAEELASEGISLSAIYRNLVDLEQENMVVQYKKEGSREIYFRYINSVVCKERFHLSCKICRKTWHMSDEESKYLENRMSQYFHFLVDKPKTVFNGTCEQCQQMEKEGE